MSTTINNKTMKKKILILSSLITWGVFYAQTSPSQTENYIYTKTIISQPADPDPKPPMESVQYFDGLGRPKQVVNVKASPLGNDIVTHIEYDGFGKQVREYLPVPQPASSHGAIVTSPVSNLSSTPYGNEKVYSEKILEDSPLDRILQQVQPGNAWSTKPVNFDYQANAVGEVKKYVTTTIWSDNATASTVFSAPTTDTLSANGYYKASQLYKTTVTDEDGNPTIEFKNGAGQTLLVRKMDGATPVDTYYVYNEYNQLAFVLSPLAVDQIKSDTAGTIIPQTVLENLCYQYRYDGRNRLVEKRLPGKGWEYMVYDNQDRLVMTQDANMGRNREWLFTKYDQFSRVAYTGIYVSTETYGSPGRDAEQSNVNGRGSNNVARTSSIGIMGVGTNVYYDNLQANSYPNTYTAILSVNYYDTYPTGTPTTPTSVLGQPVLAQNTQNSSISTKGLSTASMVKNIGNNSWTKNYTWYDTKGRPICTHSTNYLGGYTRTESQLDFAGVTQKNDTYHKKNSQTAELIIREVFKYDRQNRLKKHHHEVVGKTPQTLLSESTYDELGRLEYKKVGDNIQEMKYSYNVRGWMTGINIDANGYPIAGRLFNYKIKYNDPEKPAVAPARFNGNIAEIDWWSDGSAKRRYGYQYDGLNRLLNGIYQDPSMTQPLTHIHSESIQYDMNGNITHLYRNSENQTSYTPMLIDSLTYNYANGSGKSNRLDSIIDSSQNPSGYEGGGNTISYDDNGNMVTMPDKGISSIAYNYLNLPERVEIGESNSSTTLETVYRADGVRLKKKNTTVVTGISGTTTEIHGTDYLDGFVYLTSERRGDTPADTELKVAMEREAFSVEAKNIPGGGGTDSSMLQYFPTAEGFYDFVENKYIYQYKDHLGNVRVSFTKNSAGIAVATDKNDYYPFGMNHLNGGESFFGQGSYRNYKYNGKELQETGMYDYGARFYMPDIIRWGTIDKLSEKYPFASNYAYVLNRPTVAVDPDGKRVYFIGGAGNDQDGWDYINRWARGFAQNGINDFYRVNASRGRNEDIAFTTMYRDTGYETIKSPMYPSAMGGFGTTLSNSYETQTRPVQDDMIDATVNMYQQQLKDNPLKEGEQFNMVGYSYGSVLQAQSALRLADSGQVIDNLVLIGSPISDKSDLMKQLQGNKNIKNVTRYDLKGDALSNPQDIYDYLIKGGIIQAGVKGDDAHHFDAARPGNQADQLINTIVQWLQQQGVKN